MENLEDAVQKFLLFYKKSYTELYEELEINVSKITFKYLWCISKNEGITYSKLSKKCEVSKPTITETINKLIDKGLVYTKKSTEDGRCHHIFLTEKGKIIASTNKLELERTCFNMEKKLSKEDINNLVAILNKLS